MAETQALSISVLGVPGLRKLVNPQRIGRAVAGAVDDTSLTVEREMRQRAPRDTAAGQRSIRAHTTRQSFSRLGRITSPLLYMAVQNFGRRAGSPPPPPQALAGWARRKGYGGSLFVLARAIGRKGIRAKHFMRDAVSATKPRMKGIVAKAARRIESGQ